MEMTNRWPHWKAILGFALFALAFAWFWWITGDMFKFGNDEGIYLEGGRRVALGQQPYRDFFALTGPLTFWIEGALAWLSGTQLVIMRLPMVLDTALLVWAVYWVCSRYASALFSAAAALTFLVYETRIPKLVVNHRWDSAALATAAVVAALEAHRRGSKALWMAAGLLAATAGWATPSVLIAALPLLLWACWRGKREAAAFLGGGALVTGIAAAYLQWNHALAPLIQSMLWTGANYTGANRIPFGKVVKMAGGASDIHTVPFTQDFLANLYILLAAILPFAAVAGWCLYQRRSRHRADWAEILPLLGATAALLLSAWPRWTADELLYTAALSSGLCAALSYRVIPEQSRRAVGIILLLAAAAAAGQKAYAAMDLYPFQTRVGTVHGTGQDKEFLETLERRVPKGDSLFAFPYLPLTYYLLEAHNPTRYPYLQPGMMNAGDEASAVAELSATPPHWVIYEELPAAAILILWPGSDPARIPMAAMHAYIAEHYRDVETVESTWGSFVIKERIPDSSGAMQP
jgi:hypothetical protein